MRSAGGCQPSVSARVQFRHIEPRGPETYISAGPTRADGV
jgi:hypothetical protein